jgi:hypothetical protein
MSLELATAIFEELKTHNEYDITDIAEIHGIPVRVKIEKATKNSPLYFEICSYDVGNHFTRENSFRFFTKLLGKYTTVEEVHAYVLQSLEILPHLVLDTYHGKFKDSRQADIKCRPPLLELENIPFIKTAFDRCSVCSEPTLTKTACGHCLCLVCWSKIREKSYETENEGTLIYRPCPICRKDCYGLKETFDDEE